MAKSFLDLFGLGIKDHTLENSQAVIIPFGYEGTTTYGHGAAKGPQGLLEASAQVETFDDEILGDIYDHIKLWTMDQPQLPTDVIEACALLKSKVLEVLGQDKFPVVIGGEHTVSYGFAQALSEKYSDISILVFDSHLDLGDRWSKSDFTHASWLKYSLDLANISKATLVGIRNFNKIEWEFWKENSDKITVYQAREKKNWQARQVVDSLSNNVYISFDVDAFDSSVMPSTGTPEPGGLFWDEVLPILKQVCQKKNIIGMDLVELAPIKGFHAPDFVSAKLLMKMILYKFCATKLKAI